MESHLNSVLTHCDVTLNNGFCQELDDINDHSSVNLWNDFNISNFNWNDEVILPDIDYDY